MSGPTINGNAFSVSSLPDGPEQSGGDEMRLNHLPENTNYIVLETQNPLQRPEKRTLKDLHVELHEYLGGNTWLCRYEPTDIKSLRDLAFVKDAKPLQPELKLQPALKDDAAEGRTVDIVLQNRADDSAEDISQRIQDSLGISPEDITIRDGASVIRLTGNNDKLQEIAKIDSVGSIQEVHKLTFFNNVAREILHADATGPNTTIFKGANQIVTVADTGFDTGDKNKTHEAFTGRVKKLIPVGRSNQTNDFDGHGTHVCGSVLGDGHSQKMGGSIQGTAPEATLIVQSLLDSRGGLFGQSQKTLGDLLKEAFDHQSFIHTNSWGPIWTRQLGYNNASTDLDTFVFNHQEMTVCFAAGNDGKEMTPLGHIGAQAAAKNCIAVGSCDNRRKAKNNEFEAFKADGVVEGSPNNISRFSSRGPTIQGRIKPDVVAPGAMILSAMSRDAKPDDRFGRSSDPSWAFSSGTSMATPLVAGCVAVLRETLQKDGVTSPSAALLKALLVNGAVDTGNSSKAQGFGRVDLANSIILTGITTNKGYVEAELLDEDNEDEFIKILTLGDLLMPDGPDSETVTLKVTMVYSDLPGAALQNNINLQVAVGDGPSRFGNLGDRPDDVNNVEQVIWSGIPAESDTKITLNVSTPRTMRGDKQAFAIVWSVI
ncbi:serine protease ABC transporter B family tagB [Fusarium subglutinans]|uniref:Serine protease ABC transporter B family tagB n=1 Tax=Gibberella subglutinans TaxID=42677 RepID=A0A8H5PAU8_GIBSU|nr:serine protease ABC transporter B family tagB [Fusarium subglutinans]KAF5593136.1 serine protease ABC transporter B family tagB [Fusarium subglutinans]